MASNEPKLHTMRVNLQPRPGTPSNPGKPQLQRTKEYKDLKPFLNNAGGDTAIFYSTATRSHAENPQDTPLEESNPPQPRRIKRQDTPRPSSWAASNASGDEPPAYQDPLSRLKRQDTPRPPAIRTAETQLKNPERQGLFRRPEKRRSSQDSATEAPPKLSINKRIRNALLKLFGLH